MQAVLRKLSLTFFVIFVVILHLQAAESTSSESTIFSGRVRSLSMTRDYEGKGTGANSTLGVLLHAEGRLSGPVDESLFAGGASLGI